MSEPVQVLHQGRFLSLVNDGGWEFVSRRGKARGVVAVLAITVEGCVLLVEQFRPPVGRFVIEPPAGLVGDEGAGEESEAAAAERELLEETHYVPASTPTLLLRTPSSAGQSDEVISMYLAVGCRVAGGCRAQDGLAESKLGVGDEQIRLHVVPLAGVGAFLKTKEAQGVLVDFKIGAGLWAMSQRGIGTTLGA